MRADLVASGGAEPARVHLPPLASSHSSALLCVAAQGVWVPVLCWSRTLATACCWVSPEPAEYA